MYFQFTFFVALSILTFLLPAQDSIPLPETSGSLKDEKTFLLHPAGEAALMEPGNTRMPGQNKNRLALVTADLRPVSEGEVVEHAFYTLSYSEESEQPLWVYYKLTHEMLKGTVARTDNFRVDNRVSTLSAHPDDYKGTGYDRGHLCPAADMTVSRVAMAETFYMSNMSPQVPSFNRGIWKKLEATVRNWANTEQEIIVVTGPVFKDSRGRLPGSKIRIPGYYYKVILDVTGEPRMIALILPNQRGEKQLPEYVVTVNYVETLTGIDFFEALPDTLENRLESNSNAALWEFSELKGAAIRKETVKQCKGSSKSTGMRCRNKTSRKNGYCHLHQSQARSN